MAVAWGEAIYGRLAADAVVGPATDAGDGTHRIFPNVADQDAAFPRVVYQLVLERLVDSLAGYRSNLRGTSMQIDVYAPTYLEARNLGDAIAAVLQGVVETAFWSSLTARRENYEEDVRLHRVSQDFQLWSNEP